MNIQTRYSKLFMWLFLFCGAVLNIVSIILSSQKLLVLSFILLAWGYTFFYRKVKLEQTANGCEQKIIKIYLYLLAIVAVICLLNTYAGWVAANTLYKCFAILAFPIFPLMALFLLREKRQI